MTRTTNARLAGVAFLLYMATGMASMGLRGQPGVTTILTLLMSLSALVLGVTLYAITREVDADLALLAMICRVVEGIPGHETAAIYFAVGSTIFSWLLLRGRIIPVMLAKLGVFASLVLVIILPLQRVGMLGGATGWSSSAAWIIWMPMLAFEVLVALWLLTKGAKAPAVR
jgi:hypothetical protein